MALIDDICTEAENATIRSYKWRDRGVAPAGYIKGMAVAYARCLDQLSNGAAAAAAMAAQVGLPERDALAFYAPQFEALGETADTPVDRLRKLFALLIGLGMRESSGKHCEGRDKSAHNIDAKTAEAGLFQTSYNSVSASPILGQLVQSYAGRDDLADIFSEGVACSPASWLDHGTGPGRDYQKLTKACPAFAVEYTAVALRLIRRHWGPINNKHVEVRAASFKMLRDVEQILAASPGLPSGHTAPVSQASPTVKALVGLATAEWEFFGRSTRSLSNEWHIVGDEKNEPFSTRVGRYWRSVNDFTATGTTPQPWSAAFISWLFQAADVDERDFKPNEGHFDYIRHIHLRPRHLRLHAPTHPLSPGDLIWNSRGNSPVKTHTAALAALNSGQFLKSHVDIVVRVGAGWCESIGGNVSNREDGGSVTKSTWHLDSSGALADSRKPWIGVIDNGL